MQILKLNDNNNYLVIIQSVFESSRAWLSEFIRIKKKKLYSNTNTMAILTRKYGISYFYIL